MPRSRSEAENLAAPHFHFVQESDRYPHGFWVDPNGEIVCQDHPYWDAWNYAVKLQEGDD